MDKPPLTFRPPFVIALIIFYLSIMFSLTGCFSARGLIEVKERPLPIIFEDDSTLRMANKNDMMFLEIRRAPISGKSGNLAIRYEQIFPGGPAIRSGDRERYFQVGDNRAYRVDFADKYIRRRKRLPTDLKISDIPDGWTIRKLNPEAEGPSEKILVGPVLRRHRVLFLVEGEDYIYYVFGRADGKSFEPMLKMVKDLVNGGIEYQ